MMDNERSGRDPVDALQAALHRAAGHGDAVATRTLADAGHEPEES